MRRWREDELGGLLDPLKLTASSPKATLELRLQDAVSWPAILPKSICQAFVGV